VCESNAKIRNVASSDVQRFEEGDGQALLEAVMQVCSICNITVNELLPAADELLSAADSAKDLCQR
jgi:hypothetical protein